MTITYVQAFPPKWILINNEGTVAGGAKLYTYDSLTRQPRATYQDPAGSEAFTNPIVFDLNGTKGPIYWQIDTADPDGYYIEAYDSDGNLLWDADNFPSTGSGGGSNVTVYIPVQNYITNNQFINHIDSTASPTNTTNLVIAPSNHKGFTPALINPIVPTYGVVGPDIRFIKKNTTATDQITFPLFALASAPLTSDMTPVDYVRYQCTGAGSNESYKCFQFPITQKVKNLSNQAMTFTLWAAVTSDAVDINIYIRQYYGSGTAATADTRTLAGTCSLTTTWTKFPISLTVPDVSGNSIGTPGLQTDDDAVYVQIEMPHNATCDVLFTKPCLFMGAINPDIEFDSYDEIDSIDSTARCGDIRVSLTSSQPLGWLAMNDTSIGNTGSGATTTGAYTFQLYKTLWDGVSDTYAPVSTGRGATAQADFLAGKTLTMPLSLGRAMAGAGAGAGLTARTLGQNAGSQTVTLTGANLPTGTPFNSAGSANVVVNQGTSNNVPSNFSNSYTQGSSSPVTVLPPTTYMNVFIKL